MPHVDESTVAKASDECSDTDEYRKLNRNAEARKALEKSLALDSARVWAKEQLEKTPLK